MGRRLSFRAAILCGIFTAASAPVLAQQLVGSEVNPSKYRINTDQDRSESKRLRYAMLDTDALKGSRISLRLFTNVNLEAVGQKGRRQHRSETWTGVVDGDPFSSVVLALDESGVLFGKVEFEGRTFIVRPKTGKVHAILELRDRVPEDEGANDGVPLPDSDLDAAAAKLGAESVCLASSTCSSKTVDIMVVYTPAARTALGGSHAAAQTAIAAAVAEMNAAAANSGMSHNFNLVYSDEVQYTESANFSTDLSRLSGSTDGYMDVIHAWRDSYGADLVSLVSATGGCGIGYTQSSSTTMSPSAAFSVASPGCLTTNRTLAHEAGHNMGLHHDWFVNASSTPCAWHHGYVNQAAFGGTASQRWRTIMAYNDQCGQAGFNCTRINYFSNPLVQYTGDPMGISQGQSNPADAVFALDRTICQVAEFRASTTIPDPPMYPTDLIATGVSESAIDLSWTDNASDETGYKVQRSANESSGWSDIATLGANAETYSDAGLPQGSKYYYRTYAFHSTDQSDFSNVDSASTMIPIVDYVAAGESVLYGISSGEFSKTHSNDGTAELLTEEETDGWPQSRTSRLDVTWEFDVPAGSPLTLHVNAWTPASTDGDLVLMSYSLDGASFSPMFHLDATGDTGAYQTFDLGTVVGSSLWIRLEDTDRGRGNSATDQVFVDHMFVRAETSGDAPLEEQIPTIHIGDLQIATSGRLRWRSNVEVTVHDADHQAASRATVSGKWTDGGDGSCLTDESGVCVIGRAWRRRVESVSFSVASLSKPEAVYDPALNEVAAVVTAGSPATLRKGEQGDEVPTAVTLRQNYPNPFNPTTVLEYGLPDVGHVTVSVFNTLGMEVRRLRDAAEDAGWHSVTFDASELSSGVYIAVVHSANTTKSRVMLLTR